MDELIIVSSDGHAQMPPVLWPEYLDPRYHEFLPRLYDEAEVYPGAIWPLCQQVMTLPGLEAEHTHGRRPRRQRCRCPTGADGSGRDRSGNDLRGDHRATDLMFNIMNGVYPFDAWDAGAHVRTIAGSTTSSELADGRFLLAGAIGSCADLDETVAELQWISDHGFVGTFCPGFLSYPEMPPLFDDSWEPVWSTCRGRGLGVFVHAGFGWKQGDVYPEVERIYKHWKASGASEGELMAMLVTDIFNGEFFADLKPRRPDVAADAGRRLRSPPRPQAGAHRGARRLDPAAAPTPRRDLRRAPSRPAARAATERVLAEQLPRRRVVRAQGGGRDAPRDRRRDDLVRSRLPAPRGHMAVHERLPRDTFAGVPEDELRLMLGENAIRFLGLDRDRLAEIAARVGPTVDDIMGRPRSRPNCCELRSPQWLPQARRR